jgi:hypothetical protein
MGIYSTHENDVQQSLRDLNSLEDEMNANIKSEVYILFGASIEHDEMFQGNTLNGLIDRYGPIYSTTRPLFDTDYVSLRLSYLNDETLASKVKRIFKLELMGYIAYINTITFDDNLECSKFSLALHASRYILAFS